MQKPEGDFEELTLRARKMIAAPWCYSSSDIGLTLCLLSQWAEYYRYCARHALQVD